jgi:hypothetical protein
MENAGNFIIGLRYIIVSPGTTNFVALGAANNLVGTIFIATGIGDPLTTGIAMRRPTYVTDVNVLFNGTTTPSVVLVAYAAGPPIQNAILIRWDQALIDQQLQDDIGFLIAENGPLPYAPDLVELTGTILSNGQSFFDTYTDIMHSIGLKPTLPPAPIDKNLIYYDGAWKYLYNDAAV